MWFGQGSDMFRTINLRIRVKRLSKLNTWDLSLGNTMFDISYIMQLCMFDIRILATSYNDICLILASSYRYISSIFLWYIFDISCIIQWLYVWYQLHYTMIICLILAASYNDSHSCISWIQGMFNNVYNTVWPCCPPQ